MTPESLAELIASGDAHTVLDVRRLSSADGEVTIPGAIRLSLDDLEDLAETLPKGPPVVLFCSCPDDVTAARGAVILIERGIPNVFALAGGWNAWKAAGFPITQREPVAA